MVGLVALVVLVLWLPVLIKAATASRESAAASAVSPVLASPNVGVGEGTGRDSGAGPRPVPKSKRGSLAKGVSFVRRTAPADFSNAKRDTFIVLLMLHPTLVRQRPDACVRTNNTCFTRSYPTLLSSFPSL